MSCYQKISDLTINGTVTDTSNAGMVTQRFSTVFENDWFASDFVETPDWQVPSGPTGDTYQASDPLTTSYWRIILL